MPDQWKELKNSIEKEFLFDDFVGALRFVNEVGKLAEEMNHHPDILLYDYKKVQVTLTTHSAGGVTEKDRELARRIDIL